MTSGNKIGLPSIPSKTTFLFARSSSSSPIFYSIPPPYFDFEPNESTSASNLNNFPHRPMTGEIGYSKSGFTLFNDTNCPCTFLSEYKKQFDEPSQWFSRQNVKPWWNGREMTSKINLKCPAQSKNMDHRSIYKFDFSGTASFGGEAAELCKPEGEIERARQIVGRKYDGQKTEKKNFGHFAPQCH